ncbi:putative nuclease HARBI1 [Sycon ciliatum]|uniref:putative nuclease HARBI1 n=1 Tax=Sycon ciliatum TaxID=27933 RepID=UPI0031F6D9BB
MDEGDNEIRRRKIRVVVGIVAVVVARILQSEEIPSDLFDEICVLSHQPGFNGVLGFRTPRRVSVPRQRDYVEVVVPLQSDADFRGHFSLHRATVEIVCTKLSQSVHMAVQGNGGRKPIPVRKQLLVTLWWLGSKSTIREVADKFGLSKSTVWHSVRRVCFALQDMAPLLICWPQGQGAERTQAEFHSAQHIHGVMGAIDGCHIPIAAPNEAPETYLNRKKFHSVILQAVCDRNLLFTDAYCGWPGSVHDARVFENSPLKQLVTEDVRRFFPGEAFIVGDSAYPLLPWLMTPFRDDGHLTASQTNYNFKHSSTRMCIERAFALLKGRWRQLKYLNIVNVENATHITIAACVLHNMAIMHEDDVSDFLQDLPEGDVPNPTLYFQPNTGAADKRNRIVDLIA